MIEYLPPVPGGGDDRVGVRRLDLPANKTTELMAPSAVVALGVALSANCPGGMQFRRFAFATMSDNDGDGC